jgi:hypothetical protein
MLRIALADDQALIRHGLKAQLGRIARLDYCAGRIVLLLRRGGQRKVVRLAVDASEVPHQRHTFVLCAQAHKVSKRQLVFIRRPAPCRQRDVE